jgi:hypothetical protein
MRNFTMILRAAAFPTVKLLLALILSSLLTWQAPRSETYDEGSFDIATFTAPTGWQRVNGNGNLRFQISSKNFLGIESYCQIFLFASRTSAASPQENFLTQWRALAAKGLAPPGQPAIETGQPANGWTAVSGSGLVVVANTARIDVGLLTATGFGRFMSVFAASSNRNCATEVRKFLGGLSFHVSPDADPPVNASQSAGSAAPWSSLATTAAGTQPQPVVEAGVDTQNMTHTLQYTPPVGAFQAGADDYSFNGFNGSLRIYQFRSYSGNIQQQFQSTQLKEWIDPVHREENLGAQPTYQRLDIPGSQLAIVASFAENLVGIPKPHLRMLVVAGREAAILDASSSRVNSWQQALPQVNAVISSMRVQAQAAPPPLSAAAGNAVAGLYMGTKDKYTATMMNITGHASYTTALHFYLFSADGHVYRAYDQLSVPGGDISRFDFDSAVRTNPINSGTYTVDGDKLIIHMMGATPEAITADAPRDGMVKIGSVLYKRQ